MTQSTLYAFSKQDKKIITREIQQPPQRTISTSQQPPLQQLQRRIQQQLQRRIQQQLQRRIQQQQLINYLSIYAYLSSL